MATGSSKLLQAVLRLAAIACVIVLGDYATAQSGSLKPIYWQEKLFYIPYQANQNDKTLQQVDKVQLLLSRDGASDWRVLQEAKPNVKGFSYHAAGDGDYWFSLRHLDRNGRASSNLATQAQLRIIVDTKMPELSLDATIGLSGEVIIRYATQDANLDSTSLILEVRADQAPWTPLAIMAHDVAQPDKLVGRAKWQPPASASLVEVRAAITDQAGQRAAANAKTSLRGPNLNHPLADQKLAGSSSNFGNGKNPSTQTTPAPAQDWPANNELPRVVERQTPTADSVAVLPPPPIHNPYTVTGSVLNTPRTTAQLAGDRHASKASRPARTNRPQSLGITPLTSDNAPLAESSNDHHQDGWTSAGSTSSSGMRMVNSRTFDVEYDIESAGPWGVSKVELWGTHDAGQTWQSYGADPDNRSPLRVTVPGSGIYGFRIVVHGANGAPAQHPRTGEEAELKVAVDLLSPSLELTKVELGQGDLTGHLSVEWTAADTNLEPRPIALFYSSQPSGPWSTIAAGLENTGKYIWRIERHVPSRFYLRIIAHDQAGNRATYDSPSPISLPRPQPTGRLRNVRPVATSVETMRTTSAHRQHQANGAVFAPPPQQQSLTR